MTKHWRFRLKNSSGDFADKAWDREEVGVWYGAWGADDLKEAIINHSGNPQQYLMGLPSQLALGWTIDASPAVRFHNIERDDWIVVYLQKSREIGLAKMYGDIQSSKDHPLNNDEEIYKYRKIHQKKTFKLDKLPDAYQLIPTQGRGNVHQFNVMRSHIELLADCSDELSVNNRLKEMQFDQLLNFLGASAWESFCFAYLTLEYNFLPTGLSTGRTLPTADIVGRNWETGSRIIAQCKKNSYPIQIEEDFRGMAEKISANDVMFYFAYGGCSESVPKEIVVIDRILALNWSKTPNGLRYQSLLLKD